MDLQDKLLYSPNGAAEALSISRTKLYELMKNGSLRYVTIGSDRRIPASEVQKIAEQGAPKA